MFDPFGQWGGDLAIGSSPQPKHLSPAYQSASPLETSSATCETMFPNMFLVSPTGTAPKEVGFGSLKLNEVGEDVADLSSVSVIVLALFVGLAWAGSFWLQIKCHLNMVQSDSLQATPFADEHDAAADGDGYDLESALDDDIENSFDSSASY